MNRRGKTKEGFLYVKQPSRFGKAWKRKWLVIRPNATKGTEQSSVLLELYLEKGAYNKTVTSLLLEGITQIKRVISKSQPRAFEFIKGSVVALTLAGDSETEAQDWIEIFKKLLVPASETKELTSIPGYDTDVIRVSVVPNKDSERLKLSGNYLAGVSRLQIALHNAVTGDKVLEWDLRHLKRFMLPSKGPQQDLEKIACLQISNRSPQGEGDYLFHSPNAKPLVEAIYERLSSAITVKERRSRTSSMLFEIPPKELEQLAKAIQEGGDPGFVMVSADGSLEDEAFDEEGEKKENGENGEAKANGDSDVKTNGDSDVKTNGDSDVKTNGGSKENHADETPAEENKLENGQSEEVKTYAEDVVKEATSDESPVEVEATEVVKENGLTANGDSDIPKDDTEDKTPEEAEGDAKVEDDGCVAVSQESSDNVVGEAAQSETPVDVDELNGNVEDAKDTEDEQLVESSPVNDASADDSSSTAPIETQDFAAGPIDADEENAELTGEAMEVQPRMPPGSDELQQDSEVTESEDASEKIDERTVETVKNVECSSEQNSEEVKAESHIKLSVEDDNQVEISTDTQDIAEESAAVEESSAAAVQPIATSEDNQQQSVPTEETEVSEPSEECSPDSPKQAEESPEDAAVKAESVPLDSAESGETPATEESSATENTAQKQDEVVPDEGSSSVEQQPSSTPEQVDDVSDKSTSDEVAQNDKADSSPSESVEPAIVDEGNHSQEKSEETSDNNAVDTATQNDKPESPGESVEPPIVDEGNRVQEKVEETSDKNDDLEDTAM